MLDKDEVKDAIVSVARSIFSRFGFKKTTMDEIAIASHKGKSSIYYYFSSKEDIFRAVVEKEASILKQELIHAINNADSPAQKLKAHVLIRMNSMGKLANFYSAIKDDYLSNLDFIEKIRKKYDLEEIQMMENILNEGVEDGIFEIEDTSLAAIAIVTALKGMEIPLFWGVEEKDVEHRLDHLIHILFNGVMKR
ncbi:MAG: TetR family transcriptional regulator [Bacteroidetes bacterium HGW-Bacteroidetes-9]|jgi:AcrR family transcriptional regulator|nr:MAG: TetR family transcriptional regulator [Bacteroidetes bacterium HGW-Bacteroidetes-9]